MDLEELQVSRQHRPPKRYTSDAIGHDATTVCDYYHPLYYLLIDTAVQQLDERFRANLSLLKYQALENMLLTKKCRNVAVDLSVHEDINWSDLHIHFELF